MNADQFYHVCRSAAAIANVRELTVFGAAAVIPWIARDRPGAPWWPSMEVDLDPGGDERATLVDGSIGEVSLFEETFGVRAHGVTLGAFIAPPDWPDRAAVFEDPVTRVRVRAPHPLDLAVAKLVRGDERDWSFAAFCGRYFQLSTDALASGLRAAAASRPEHAPAVEYAVARLPALAQRSPAEDGGAT